MPLNRGAAGGDQAAADGAAGEPAAAAAAEQRPRRHEQRQRAAHRGQRGRPQLSGLDIRQGELLRVLLQEEEHQAWK